MNGFRFYAWTRREYSHPKGEFSAPPPNHRP